jgi:hypothetical protein
MSERYTMEKTSNGWELSIEKGESIFPTTTYKTKRLVVARLSQLLDIGPVAPQTHPERICIGVIE